MEQPTTEQTACTDVTLLPPPLHLALGSTDADFAIAMTNWRHSLLSVIETAKLALIKKPGVKISNVSLKYDPSQPVSVAIETKCPIQNVSSNGR